MKTINQLFIILIMCALSGITQAQTFEIRSVNKGSGIIGIEVRETSGTNTPTTSDYVTDIVFGLSWDTGYQVNLGAINTSFYITKAGTRSTKGDKHFQAFYANNTPYTFPSSWNQNDWVEIASIPNTLTSSGTGTFAIAANGFHVTTDVNFGLNLSDFTPTIGASATNVLLPIDLLTFDATLINKTTHLRWSTANEINMSHFMVERSLDGENFEAVGREESKGNSFNVQYYSSSDDVSEITSPYIYYRLKMVEWDGIVSTSPIVKVNLAPIESNVLVYPCPFVDQVYMDCSKAGMEPELEVKVYDYLGIEVYNQTFWILDEPVISMDLKHLNSGFYNLVYSENGEQKTVKLVK